MTDDEVREALKLALDAWEAAKRQTAEVDDERAMRILETLED